MMLLVLVVMVLWRSLFSLLRCVSGRVGSRCDCFCVGFVFVCGVGFCC